MALVVAVALAVQRDVGVPVVLRDVHLEIANSLLSQLGMDATTLFPK